MSYRTRCRKLTINSEVCVKPEEPTPISQEHAEHDEAKQTMRTSMSMMIRLQKYTDEEDTKIYSSQINEYS